MDVIKYRPSDCHDKVNIDFHLMFVNVDLVPNFKGSFLTLIFLTWN